MARNLLILMLAALVVALPFVFRRPQVEEAWREGDPVVIVISPQNEAIRREFSLAFSGWHRRHYGRPARIDWRTIGGTTEIMRYLESEITASFRAWWRSQGHVWPADGGSILLDRRFDPDSPREGETPDSWNRRREMVSAFRGHDDARFFGAGVDVFFGGGAYDHGLAQAAGLTVPPWPADDPPPGLLADADGRVLYPFQRGGETWRTDHFFGAAVSTFGICYNVDRLQDLGLPHPPAQWRDLTHPAYAGQLGMADPTKSGSMAKTFEMILYSECLHAVREAGFGEDEAAAFEELFAAAGLPAGQVPPGVPPAYQRAIEQGWANGLLLLQRIAANARYFTDSAGKVPVDVSQGDAAAGLAIDFFGRYQAEIARLADGRERMGFVTPSDGSSVSADPISLLRGAPAREPAVRFLTFVLSEEGQQLWNYAPGAPGGPRRFALRRLPARADFYPSRHPDWQAAHERHLRHSVDALDDPLVNPYALTEGFTYHPRWTGRHFGFLRDFLRAMGLDAGDELRAAWRQILEAGGPEAAPGAMARLGPFPQEPEPLTWSNAPGMTARHGRMETLRAWTLHYRRQYAEVRRLATETAGTGSAP